MRNGYGSKEDYAIPVVCADAYRWPSTDTLRKRIYLGRFPPVSEDYLRAYEQGRKDLSRANLRLRAKRDRN